MLCRHMGSVTTEPVGSVEKSLGADCSQSLAQNMAAHAVFRTLIFARHASLSVSSGLG